MRPNVIMKHDVNVVETLHMKMQDNYEKFETKNDNRSVTIIEIGASPAFPQVRRLAETKLLNDKVRCCLIRINPIKERQSLYNWEEREITKIIQDKRDEFNIDTKIPNFLEMNTREITRDED